MNQEFRNLFNQLCNQQYEAHWFTRVLPGKVLQGEPSDCSDRTYTLADWCEKNNLQYEFVLTLFLDKGLHMAIVIDNFVYDPIWKLYETPLKEYQRILNGTFSHVFGSWIEKIIP